MKQTINPFYTCMLLLAGTLLSSAALAEDIYKWLNDNGEVQYTCLLYTSPSPRDED